MNWEKKAFGTRAAHGAIARQGYISETGVFGIAKDRTTWWLFHMPTGMSFLYSEWPTFRAARAFAELVAAREPWDDPQLDRHPDHFNEVCQQIAAEIGAERRRMVQIA